MRDASFVSLISRPDPVKSAFNTTRTARMTSPKPNLEDVLKASLIIGEALEEVADAKVGDTELFFSI